MRPTRSARYEPRIGQRTKPSPGSSPGRRAGGAAWLSNLQQAVVSDRATLQELHFRGYGASTKSEAGLDITYDKLSGSLGSLLLVWAAVEKTVRQEIIRAHGVLPARAHGIAAALRTWESGVIESQSATSLGPLLATTLRSQMQRPLDIRNGVCHGLVGMLMETEQKPAELHWEINDEKHSICWDDFQQQLHWLSRIPRAVSIISNLSMDRMGSTATNTAENREWWRSEFSLELPEP